MTDFLIGIINWVERTVDLLFSLGAWSIIGLLYALSGFMVGTYFRKKHDHDSLHYPIWMMFVFVLILLPFTVYIFD